MDTAMYSERRAMFKASPLRFTFMLLLVPVLGLGLLLLLVWYLRCVYQNLEIVDGLIVYKSGVLSKENIELQAIQVRSTRIEQSLMHRIFNIGDIYITSSGSSPEIIAINMPNPKRVREIISYATSRLNTSDSGSHYSYPQISR